MGDQPGTSGGHKWAHHKVLMASCSGLSAVGRHLYEDLSKLFPHCKKEKKLRVRDVFDIEGSHSSALIASLCELKHCDLVLLMESRNQGHSTYMTVGNAAATVRFQVHNVQTVTQLSLHGNHRLGTRPVLSFDKSFVEGPEPLRVMRELLRKVFSTPHRHAKTLAVVDHIMQFTQHDGFIVFRNYGAEQTREGKTGTGIELTESGPRFILQPVAIQEGLFGAKTLWRNANYINPSEATAIRREEKAAHFQKRIDNAIKQTKRDTVPPANDLDDVLTAYYTGQDQ
ncbi:ribosome biogenesis protein BRX1 [Kipferlia bialata]|uniref:Ribosome biogenesis protein BRX1 n=1 Tax=Kipferlia bialata TaxID=797122 RepID=A0A9K3D1D4_9EUKA|nr:ribosome biogenesis protein BRX1 [Kipferlia bialata]|eukprot:g8852.t1